MQLDLNDDQRLYKDSFERFFASESTPERVRAAEPLGFDPALWRGLAALGALPMRAPEAAGGGGAGLMEAVLLMEQAGKRLASAPLAEAIVAARLLGELGGAAALGWLTRLGAGMRW